MLRTYNPYGNPCPQCGARRYERCFKETGIDPETTGLPGAKDFCKFIYIKDKPCAKRVPLTLGIGYQEDNEGEQGEMIGDEYSGCDL